MYHTMIACTETASASDRTHWIGLQCSCRIDAWERLYPKDPGYTYDGKANFMLGPRNNLRGRLDRIFYLAECLQLKSIQMVGLQALPGVTYMKQLKQGPVKLSVLPSDHFGLLASWSLADSF